MRTLSVAALAGLAVLGVSQPVNALPETYHGTNEGYFYVDGSEFTTNFPITYYNVKDSTKYYDKTTGAETTQSDSAISATIKEVVAENCWVTYAEGSTDYAVTRGDDVNRHFFNVNEPGGTTYNYGGGLSVLDATRDLTVTGGFVDVTFSTELETLYGGALYNRNSTITNLTGDFIYTDASFNTSIDNKMYGGVIANINGSSINNLKANFYTNSSHSIAALYGGNIYNDSTSNISVINSGFYNSYSATTDTKNTPLDLYGGVIYNSGTLGEVNAEFINNISNSYYGEDVTDGSDANIYGNVLYNNNIINSLNASFMQNSTNKNVDLAKTVNAYGGAIYNDGTITNITGYFGENEVLANAIARGGAVYNNGTLGATSISGINFYKNIATAGTGVAEGGAIYNAASGVINGNSLIFAQNSAQSSGSAAGGAIYNTGNLVLTNTSFVGNSVVSGDSGTARGGAIYTTSNLDIVADGGNSIFSGNYTQQGASADKVYNAIYVGDANAKLSLTTKAGSTITLNDSIDGVKGYSLVLGGEVGGKVSLYNDVTNAAMSATNVVVDLQDGATNKNYALDSLKVDNSAKFNIDVDLANGVADKISTAELSEGKLLVDNINFVGNNYDSLSKTTTIQLIDNANTNSTLELELGEAYQDQIVTDLIDNLGDTIYNDKTYKQEKGLTLYKTDTQNDSIRFQVEKTHDALTLATSHEVFEDKTRTFKFETADSYKLANNIDSAVGGTLNIEGLASTTRNVLDLNSKEFNFNGETTLNIKDVELANGSMNLTSTASDKVTMNLTNAKLNSAITATETYDLNIQGANTTTEILANVGNANATLTNAELIISEDALSSATLNTTSGTLNLQDNNTSDFNIGTLNATNASSVNVDVNLTDGTSDKIIVGENSTGTVLIDSINQLNGDVKPKEDVTLKVLDIAGGSPIKVALSDKASATYQFAREYEYKKDEITAEILHDQKFYNYTNNIDREAKFVTSGTDSILWDVTKTVTRVNGDTLGDTLALANTLVTNEDRVFRFNSSADDKTYTVTDNLGTTAAGKFTVTGQDNTVNIINANNKTLFNLVNNTNLEIENVAIKNSNGAVVKLNNANATAKLTDVVISDTTSAVDNVVGSVDIISSEIKDLTSTAIVNDVAGRVSITDTTFSNNAGEYIKNKGIVDVIASTNDYVLDNSTTGKILNDGTINLNGTAKKLTVSDEIANLSQNAVGNISVSGDVTLTENITAQNLVNNGNLTLKGLDYANSTITNKSSLTLNDTNIQNGSLILEQSSTATVNNTLATEISANVSGNGSIVQNSPEAGSLTFTGNNSAFTGALTVNSGVVKFNVDNIAKFAKDATITASGTGSKLEYNSTQASTSDNVISLGSEFANVSLSDEATLYINANGKNTSYYSIDNGFASQANGNIVFSDAHYNLNNKFTAGDVLFSNSIVTVGDNLISSGTNYDLGSANLGFENSSLDLINKVAGNKYTVNGLEFNGDNNTMTLDVNLFYSDSQKPYADMITSTNGSGQVTINSIFITDDNGILSANNDKGIIQVFEGNNTLKVAEADNLRILSWATNVYKYGIDSAKTVNEADSIRVTAKGFSSSDTLRDLNLYEGSRGFNYIADNTNHIYNLYRDLDSTNEGSFVILGANTQDKSLLDGTLEALTIPVDEIGTRLTENNGVYSYDGVEIPSQYISFDADGNATIAIGAFSPAGQTQGSMFELVNKTDLKISDLSIENAKRYSTDTIKDGSVIYANNADATVSLTKTDLKNNSAAGNGGAIANILSKDFSISEANISGNTAGGLGGAIYTETDMVITDSNFANNSDSTGANDIYIAENATVTFETTGSNVNSISSGIAGNGKFVKSGEGTLNLSGKNSGYTGALAINDGLVKYLGNSVNDSFVNAKSISIDNGAQLDVALGSAQTANISNLSGAGKLVLDNTSADASKLVLKGNNSGFTGDVEVNAATLSYQVDSASDSLVSGTTKLADNSKLEVNVASGVNGVTLSNFVSNTATGSTARVEINNNASYTGDLSFVGDNSGYYGDLDIHNGVATYLANNSSDKFISGKTNIRTAATLKTVLGTSISGLAVSNISGAGKFVLANTDTNSILNITGDNSGFSGNVDIQRGILAYTQSANDKFFNASQISISENGTLDYTINDSATLSPITGMGTLVKNGSGTVNLTGDNSGFGGLVDINEGTVSYDSTKASKIFGNAAYDIASGAKLLTSGNANIQNVSGQGGVTHSNGALSLAGNNQSFTGLFDIQSGNVSFIDDAVNSYVAGETKLANTATLEYTAQEISKLTNVSGSGTVKYVGNSAFTFNESENTNFAGNFVVAGKNATVQGLDGATGFKYNTLISGAASDYNYNAGTGANLTLDSTAFGFSQNNLNATAKFDGGSYTLANNISNVSGNTVQISNADSVKFSSTLYSQGNYSITNSIIDLTGGSKDTVTFDNLGVTDSSVKLDIDFKATNSHSADKLIANNIGGDLALKALNITNSLDNGLGSPHTIQVLGGKLNFNQNNSITSWSTDVYDYDVSVNGQNVILTAIKAFDDDSLDHINDMDGNRGFQFTTSDNNPYEIKESLGQTGSGSIVVNGEQGGSTVVSGGNQNSFFEVTKDTDLEVNNMTITNANGTSGSVINANNASATVKLDKVTIESGSSTGNGGVINNTNSESFEVLNGSMSGNTSGGLGGAIYTEADMVIKDTNFENNTDSTGSNDIYIAGENTDLTFIVNVSSNVNSGVAGNGNINKTGNGILYLDGTNKNFTGDLNISEGSVSFVQDATNSFISSDSKINVNSGANLDLGTSSDAPIKVGNLSGAGNVNETGSGSVDLVGDNSGFTGSLALKDNSSLNFNADNDKYISGSTSISTDSSLNITNNKDFTISKVEDNGTIVKDGSGNLIFAGNNSFNGNLEINGGSLSMAAGSSIGTLNDVTFADGTSLNLQNTQVVDKGNGSFTTYPNPPSIENLYFDNLTVQGNVNLLLDIDLKNQQADKVGANTFNGGHLVINQQGLNVVTDSLLKDTNVQIAYGALANGDNVILSDDAKTVMGPIQRYDVTYSNGMLGFSSIGGNAPVISNINPNVMASSVATQVGGYLTQLETLHSGFYHMDKYTKYPYMLRSAAENRNVYALAETPVYNRNFVPLTSSGMWVKPYTTFERVNLRGGIGVSNVSYGTLYGGDSELYNLGNGYKGVISAFVGYNGSHQSYSGISMNQQGGTLGVTGTLYKGNFFTGITASTGASTGEAHTHAGRDSFAMMTAGIASKTGYNWEINDGKFIVQPSMFLGYTFVNTFEHNTAAGVNIDSDPLHAVQLIPGVRFIANTKNGWQPYASVDMVWNLMGKTDVMANDVRLPQLSVKPYVQYGVGVQRSWADRFTAFFQTMIRNGGRNGVSLTGGFRWSLGRDGSTDDQKVQEHENKKIINATNKNKINI